MPVLTKACFKCGITKPLDDFYRHAQMGDGHLNKCKDCTKADVKANYRAHWNEIRAYEHERNQRPERKAKKREYYRRAPAQHMRARQAVNNAVRDGRLQKQPCDVCGARAEAHHDDHSRPFDVRWLCFRHHREIAHGQRVGIEGNDWRPSQP